MGTKESQYDTVLIGRILPWIIICGVIFGYYYGFMEWGGEYPVLISIYDSLGSWFIMFAVIGAFMVIIGSIWLNMQNWGDSINMGLPKWLTASRKLFKYSVLCVCIHYFWNVDYVQALSEGAGAMDQLQHISLSICAIFVAMFMGCFYMCSCDVAQTGGKNDS